MHRTNLSTKLLVAYAVVILASFALIAIPLHLRLRQDYISRATRAFESALAMRMGEIRAAADRGDHAALDLACDRLNAGFHGRVTILGADGNIIADSMSARCLERARPDCLPAIRAQNEAARRNYTPLDDTLSVRLHVTLASLGPATVRLALPIQPVRLQIAQMNRLLLMTALGAMLAAALIGIGLARRIARPVEEMTLAAERIAAGEFDHELPRAGSDEIGRLSEAFATMQHSLKRTLSDLRTERNQAQAIVSNMSDGVLALSADRRVLYANDAAANLLLDGPQTDAAEDAALPADVDEAVSAALKDRTSVTIETGDVRRGERAVRTTVTPLRDAVDGGVAAVLVLCDMTDARRAENMGRDLVANASHELRTPLAIMASTVDTMLAWSDTLSEQQQEFLQIISRQAERMQGLIKETLQLSQLEADCMKERPETISLKDIVRQVVAALGPMAARKDITLTLDDRLDSGDVKGIEPQLTGAVTNLIDNALRYTPEGGTVTVLLERRRAMLEVCVSDTGPGIPPAEHKQIFERFVRGRAADDSHADGSGLGLAIVRRIAEIHHGRVELESRPGQGSTFRFLVPEHTPAAAS